MVMLINDSAFHIQHSTFLGGAAIRIQSVPLWAWWIPLVWAISLPWAGLTKDPQWSRVHPVPFTDPADRPRDLIANIALYIPFGYSLARGRRWPLVVGVTTGVSLGGRGDAAVQYRALPVGDGRYRGGDRRRYRRRLADVGRETALTKPNRRFDSSKDGHATRPALRVAAPLEESRLRARHRTDAGAWHRREHRDLQRGQRRRAEAAAVSRTRAAGLHHQPVSRRLDSTSSGYRRRSSSNSASATSRSRTSARIAPAPSTSARRISRAGSIRP